MPGAYAHITLVNIAKETPRLEAADLPHDLIRILLSNFQFCELGAVSPDYPYLDIAHPGASRWADLMHYEHTGEMIKSGVRRLKRLEGPPRDKALAWLLGYTAHVIADVTIHPVVELKVGEYSVNAKEHRICELNQDAYIYQRLGLSDIGISEHLDTGIWNCCDSPNSGYLDPAVTALWRDMLVACYPAEFERNEPDIDDWHRGFKRAVDVAEEGNLLVPFARHIAVNCGLTYPAVARIDQTYIRDLITPEGVMHYDQVFDRALDNVVRAWAIIGTAIFDGDQRYQTTFRSWNLDTGRDAAGNYEFWQQNVHAA